MSAAQARQLLMGLQAGVTGNSVVGVSRLLDYVV
jgi:hypothetical protein